ncbi:hypothetical protein [Bacillus sp. RAR_GA_16]|uniref:hypothetical protein n=1 Tax=Bacillus sp. RAR_GA_16 TaxID=2876774 RepID=UPI001CCBDEE4|nr:hypothetical protein [Bacillus sp. RAR_GA_16]MCA0173979.1 hypothetical protein [Bacillus sp. RAR_GA_16]
MKRILVLLGIALLLGACGNEERDGAKSDTSLVIEPADLSEREQAIVNQMGVDYQTFYTLDGEINEGEVLEASIDVYENGEGKRVISSVSNPDGNEFNQSLHSFQLLMEEKESFFTLGEPSGYARGTEFLPDDLESYSFVSLEDNVTMKKGEPVYLAYLVGTSQSELSTEVNENKTALPKSVQEAEYAVVFKLEIKNEQ